VDENDVRLVSVVDDDESLRRSVKNLLTSVGFRVETFVSAEAFLQSAHRADTRCVVLDLRMPGMSGVDLLMHLAAAGSPIPVVILTAHSDDEARRRTLQAGAVAFLGKPFHGEALLGAVRRALAQNPAQNPGGGSA
jgi:FixJ family two-component response regulator